MQNYLILVEGHTEEYLLKKPNVIGKIQIFNLWDKDVQKIARRFNSNTAVFVVYDTDTAQSQSNIARFNANLAFLKQGGRLKGILQQTFNFEDELVLACDELRNSQGLFKVFDAVNADEFKYKFLKSDNPIALLEKQGFDKMKLWKQKVSANVDSNYHKYLADFGCLLAR